MKITSIKAKHNRSDEQTYINKFGSTSHIVQENKYFFKLYAWKYVVRSLKFKSFIIDKQMYLDLKIEMFHLFHEFYWPRNNIFNIMLIGQLYNDIFFIKFLKNLKVWNEHSDFLMIIIRYLRLLHHTQRF